MANSTPLVGLVPSVVTQTNTRTMDVAYDEPVIIGRSEQQDLQKEKKVGRSDAFADLCLTTNLKSRGILMNTHTISWNTRNI